MATWWTLEFEGEPTEADFRRVSEMTAQGYLSGQLINEPGAEDEEGPATGYYYPGVGDNEPALPTGHHRALAEAILAAEEDQPQRSGGEVPRG